jgi:hypothetical protein
MNLQNKAILNGGIVPRLFALVLASIVAAVIELAAPLPTAAVEIAPVVSVAFVGSPQPVFDSLSGCETIDIPDASARAFRDDHGVVHLIATHFVARAMLGSNLDAVKHDCHVIYRSPQDSDPAHFQYDNWLYSFYTIDGRRIAALVHSEYHGEATRGGCATPAAATNCWWNTVSFAQSFDGGNTFAEPPPPRNLVASLPYPYLVGNQAGAYGYYQPTNILKVGAFYYAMINDWPYKAQKYGPCLMRTQSLFDASSWRAWDGNDFTIRFVNPYAETPKDPNQHVCEPVLAGVADSLVQVQRTGTFIVTQITPDSRFGPPGMYVTGSRDLIHWSKPTLIAKLTDLATTDGPGSWNYAYSSILDPKSKDRNFSVISETPFLYYVRLDRDHAPYARVLFRRPISLQISESPTARLVPRSPGQILR